MDALVEQAAVGDWAGLDGKVVSFTPAGWRAQTPFEGQSVRVRSTGVGAVYHDGAWEMGVVRASSVTIGGEQVVGSRTGAISSPTGGTIVDVEGPCMPWCHPERVEDAWTIASS